MKKTYLFLSLFFAVFLFPACSTTFAGSVFVLTFSDVVLYVILALLMAFLISLKRDGKILTSFWIGFILSLLLTPLAGLFYLLFLAGRKKNEGGDHG